MKWISNQTRELQKIPQTKSCPDTNEIRNRLILNFIRINASKRKANILRRNMRAQAIFLLLSSFLLSLVLAGIIFIGQRFGWFT